MSDETVDYLKRVIDPVRWVEYEIEGFKCDDWQKDALQADDRELMFNCCRQSGKSTIASIKAVHYCVQHDGALVILISPSDRQSSELFRKVRYDVIARMRSPPVLVEDNQTSLRMANGSRIVSLPSSVDTIIGYSAVDILIEDEASRVKDEIPFATLPMLAVSNGQYIQLSTPKGQKGHFFRDWTHSNAKKFEVKAGAVPRIPLQFLNKMKVKLGSLVYQQEFECSFIDVEGMNVRPEWLKEYTFMPPQFDFVVHSWDTAFKTGQENDYSVCTVWGATQFGYYLLDVHRLHVNYPDLKKKCFDLYNRDHPEAVLIEDAASGQSLIQDLQRETSLPIVPIKVDKDKSTRLAMVAPLFEAGRVLLPESSGWKSDYLDELFAFPSGEHDDQVDSTTQALTYLKDRGYGDNSSLLNDHSEPMPDFGLDDRFPDMKGKAPWDYGDGSGFKERDIVPYL